MTVIMTTVTGGSRILEWGMCRALKAQVNIKMLTEWGLGRGIPLPNGGRVWGGGTCPLPRNFFNFLAQNGAF